MVREWAHLRWGLFDESPKGSDPLFYASGSIPKPTGLVLVCYFDSSFKGQVNHYPLNIANVEVFTI